MTAGTVLDQAPPSGPAAAPQSAAPQTRHRHPALRRVGRLALRRAAQVLLVSFVVGTLTFVLVHLLPGDPAEKILGPHATASSLAALRKQLGLNQSLLGQFGTYYWHLAHGNFGTSLVEQGRPVLQIVLSDLAVTGPLIGLTIILSVALGVPLGLWGAITPKPALDLSLRTGSIVLLGTPPFLVGIVVIDLVALRLHAAPAGGWGSGWPGDLRYIWLPSIALSLGYLGPLVLRTVRQSASDVWREPYIEAALSRGLSTRRVVLRHVLPNSALPVITLVGLSAAMLISGTVVVETVFGLPGLGSELASAVQARDYPVVQGIALLTGIAVVLINMAADVLYTLVDPRTRRGNP